MKVPAAEFAKYDLAGRAVKHHRAQIREALGFRPSTRADEERLIAWLAEEVCPVEPVEDRLREALLMQCRADQIEPPGRVERIVNAAQAQAEEAFCARTIERLGETCAGRLLVLVAEDNETGAALLASLKRDPGAVGPDSLLTEIDKLNDVRKLGLPDGLSRTARRSCWPLGGRGRSRCTPSDFRETAEGARVTLPATLCASRQAEITDALSWSNINPYGTFRLDMDKRLDLLLSTVLPGQRGAADDSPAPRADAA